VGFFESVENYLCPVVRVGKGHGKAVQAHGWDQILDVSVLRRGLVEDHGVDIDRLVPVEDYGADTDRLALVEDYVADIDLLVLVEGYAVDIDLLVLVEGYAVDTVQVDPVEDYVAGIVPAVLVEDYGVGIVLDPAGGGFAAQADSYRDGTEGKEMGSTALLAAVEEAMACWEPLDQRLRVADSCVLGFAVSAAGLTG
jgi:hypothetical protein